MRRWLRRILYTLLIVIVLVLITVQVVLWTDWPRRLVLGLVQQNLGLRVEARALSTGWFGNTTLRDVRLSLPLADESFLDMPTMNVEHTALLPLAITRQFELRGIELNKPNLVVRRNNAGRWNIQDVAELIAKATAGTPEPGTKKKPPKLPTLRLNDGTIAIIDDRNGGKALIAPLTATGDPDGPLVYRYHASVPDKLVLSGQVAPGENFKHEASFGVRPPVEWIKPWVANPPQPLRLDGNWTGVVVNNKAVAGRLELTNAQVTHFGARGALAVQTSGDDSVITPKNFIITTPIAALPQVQLASGTIQVHGDAITLQQVRLGAVGGLAQIDGSADIAAKTAEINGIWQDIVAPAKVTQSGSVHLTIKNLFPSRPDVRGTIVTRGRVPQGSWDGEITLAGNGRDWTEMDWQIGVPRVAWRAKVPLDLENVSARVTHRGQMITLTELRWPEAERLVSRGELNLRDKTWLLRVRGGSTIGRMRRAPANLPETAVLDFNLDTYGNAERVHLNELFLRARGIEVKAAGDYVFGIPEPVAASIYVTHVPSDLLSEEELPVRGKLLSEVHVGGTLEPMNLAVKGVVRSENLVVYNRPYGDIRGVVSAKVEENTLRFGVQDLLLFGGNWGVSGIWPYDEKDKMSDTFALRATVTAKDVSLRDLGEVGGTTAIDGKASGSWTIDIPKMRRDLMAAKGSFEASDVVAAAFKAEKVTGQLSVRNGLVRIDPLELRQGKGTTVATIETTFADLRKPSLLFNTNAWPVAVGRATAELSAEANLVLDAKTKSAIGPIKARAVFATTQQSIGEANIDGRLEGRIASIDTIKVAGFGGTAEGRATINADAPNTTNAVLGWNGIDGKQIAHLVPKLDGLDGKFSGALTLDPTATSDRALEPLRLRLQLNSDNGHFRSAEVGPAKLSAFFNLGPNFALTRVVLDKLPGESQLEVQREAEFDQQQVPVTQRPLAWNDIRIGDGRVRLWARRGQHEGGDVQTHIIIDFQRLDLNQLVHASKPESDPMPGRLTGQLIVHGDPNDLDAVIGDGHVGISESDLGKVDVLEVLYNAMSLGTAPKEPIGAGSLDLRLQRSTLTLNNIYYFNRGIEAWSSDLTIHDAWKMPDSPMEGYVVGSARPLAALKLPLLADVDQVLSVLQSNLTTVRVDGTVAAPDPKIATFNEVGSGFKQFLTGKVNESRTK
jgi:hypothetical protein